MTLRLAIAGAKGRMGQMLTQAVLSSSDWVLGATFEKIEKTTSQQLADNTDLTDTVVSIKDINNALTNLDVLIDFSVPCATLGYLDACVRHNVPMVIGTTGFSDIEQSIIKKAASHIAIVLSPNFSIGINLALKLLDLSARTLGNDYEVEIVEAHHHHKIDTPSGTALKMGEVIANALGRDLKKCAVYERQTLHCARDPQSIGFSSIRAGNIVGEHSVWFVENTERIEITHKANSRLAFAKGALRAASWIVTQPAGLYSMQDVIG